MNIVELLFGIGFAVMALWGVVGGEIYVLGGKANEGSWASFGDHPVMFSLVFIIYLLCGVFLIRDGLKKASDHERKGVGVI